MVKSKEAIKIENTKNIFNNIIQTYIKSNIINKSCIEYIYLLQTPYHIKFNENVYKLGKTKLLNFKRFTYYPNGSIVYHHTYCKNSDICEKILLNLFRKKYIERKDIGNEYFEGNLQDMIININNIVSNYNNNDTVNKIANITNFLYKTIKLLKGIFYLLNYECLQTQTTC
jgi:hypothetical protein